MNGCDESCRGLFSVADTLQPALGGRKSRRPKKSLCRARTRESESLRQKLSQRSHHGQGYAAVLTDAPGPAGGNSSTESALVQRRKSRSIASCTSVSWIPGTEQFGRAHHAIGSRGYRRSAQKFLFAVEEFKFPPANATLLY